MGSFCAAFIAGYSAPSSEPMSAMTAARSSHPEVISTGSVWKRARNPRARHS